MFNNYEKALPTTILVSLDNISSVDDTAAMAYLFVYAYLV